MRFARISCLILLACLGCGSNETTTPGTSNASQVLTGDQLADIASRFKWTSDHEAAQQRQEAIAKLESAGVTVQRTDDPLGWINCRSIHIQSEVSREYPDNLVVGICSYVDWIGGHPDRDLGFKIPGKSDEPLNLPLWKINDELLEETLPHLPDCRFVDLKGSVLTDRGVAIMCQLPCLAQLEITNTWIHRYPSLITNRAMVHVGAHPHLQKVFVACQPITNESMKHLSRSQSIEVVDICNCPITSEALIYLAELPNLKLLRVRTSLDWYIAPESYEPDFREWSPEIEQAIRKIKSKSPYVEIGDIPIHPKIRSAFEGMEEPQVDCSES